MAYWTAYWWWIKSTSSISAASHSWPRFLMTASETLDKSKNTSTIKRIVARRRSVSLSLSSNTRPYTSRLRWSSILPEQRLFSRLKKRKTGRLAPRWTSRTCELKSTAIKWSKVTAKWRMIVVRIVTTRMIKTKPKVASLRYSSSQLRTLKRSLSLSWIMDSSLTSSTKIKQN